MSGISIFDHLHFQNPLVRDLAWAVFSPSLLDSKSGLEVTDDKFLGVSHEALVDFRSRLGALDHDPQSLESAIGEASHRLGDYFEALIEFWLRSCPCCHKIERHFHLSLEHKGLGEFGFLYFSDLVSATCHLEVACRYYLLQGDPDNLASYVGLDRKDTLEKKIFALRRRLALSNNTRVKALLEKEQLLPITSACLIKGYILYPLNDDASFVPIPTEGIHTHHLSGWWARHDDRLWKERVGETRLLILPKREWLAPREYDEGDVAFLKNSFLREDRLPQKPPFLLAVYHLGDGIWKEHERGMIVN
jgi:hypothetical protein